jgi:hypothetical protein
VSPPKQGAGGTTSTEITEDHPVILERFFAQADSAPRPLGCCSVRDRRRFRAPLLLHEAAGTWDAL